VSQVTVKGLYQMRVEKGQDIQIRLAAPADAAAIASLLYKSFVEYEALYTQEGFATTISTPNLVQARMDEGPVWVALENGAVVGTVSAVLKDQGLYIRGMAVDPSARGKGIGRNLLDCAEKFAIESRCSRLFLSTTPFLSRAIKLYEVYGFRRCDGGPDNLFGTPLFTMVKPLLQVTLRTSEGSSFECQAQEDRLEEEAARL
jgi:ribosomal protein S18 acetylase RimI-like enzyme